ncbi:MAG: YqgE/AlgH family protein [Bacteroidota bacterium]
MENIFDFKKLNKLPPEKGKILISEPFLDDDFFKRSVVLLCEHNEEGSFGFVLNNFVDINLHELIDELPDVKMRISVGGPVKNDNLYYIHTLGEKIPGSLEVMKGIYMGGSYDVMKEAISNGEVKSGQLRFFVGYSGWDRGQLEKELEMSAWLVARADAEDVMNTDIDDLWKKILTGMGKEYSAIANFPDDPTLN